MEATGQARWLERLLAECRHELWVADAAQVRPEVRRLRIRGGVGPVVGLVYVLTILDPTRFASSRQVASYLGLIPSERSSASTTIMSPSPMFISELR